MSVIEIKHPELLAVTDGCGPLTAGGDQHWFPKEGFIPPGACGATAASNVLAYLLRARPKLYTLAQETGLGGISSPAEPNTKDGYLAFMKKVYRFLYPRMGGLMANQFLEGMAELANEYGIPVSAQCLRVPIAQSKRPSFAEAAAFICSSLSNDIPVAFLILSGGSVAALDTWHWVTILAFDEDGRRIKILDNTEVFWAELDVWLETSIMGGSFVRLVPDTE